MSEASITIELNPQERRFYDRIRQHVVKEKPGLSSSARDVLLLLPDLTILLFRLLREERVPIGAKALALVGVGYVFSPIDLLPAFLLGPVGLVDDLLVVSAALSRILNHVHPDVVRAHWSGKGDALDAIQRVSAWSESLFTHRIWKALRKLFPGSPR